MYRSRGQGMTPAMALRVTLRDTVCVTSVSTSYVRTVLCRAHGVRVVVVLAPDFAPLTPHLLAVLAEDTQPFSVAVTAGPTTGPGLQVCSVHAACARAHQSHRAPTLHAQHAA